MRQGEGQTEGERRGGERDRERKEEIGEGEVRERQREEEWGRAGAAAGGRREAGSTCQALPQSDSLLHHRLARSTAQHKSSVLSLGSARVPPSHTHTHQVSSATGES